MKPRKLELEQLVTLLEEEHRKVESELGAAAELISAGNVDGLSLLLQSLDGELMQHMLDEEASVLAVLIKAYGRNGSADAIRVFKEHVRIREMILEIRKKLEVDPAKCAALKKELESFMLEHFKKEDAGIFPLALEANLLLKKAEGESSAGHTKMDCTTDQGCIETRGTHAD